MPKHKSRRKERKSSRNRHHHHDHHRHKTSTSKRQRSRSCSRASSDSDSLKPTTSTKAHQENEPTNLVNFSFLDYKSELTKVLLGFTSRDRLIDDPKDFWLFLQKYENILKYSGQSILPNLELDETKRNQSLHSKSYDKSLNTNLKLAVTFSDLYGRLSSNERGSKITEIKLRQFLQIVVHYLDFRQKEKLSKIKKLRRAQANLPVAKYKAEITSAVQNERVVLIAGDTGCGKSTQVPQYLYQAGYQSIACTQPRRIACISLSKRVAHEMLCEYGTEVGYQIRFERSKNKDTKIVFITEGLLLRQLATEAALSQYDVIVLDEVHERHLHGDFLLGVTKCLLKTRPELKLVLMSATINIKLFSEYFQEEDVHVIEVPGRLYPIKLHYMPQIQDISSRQSKAERLSPEPYIQIMQLIDNKYPSKYFRYFD